MNEQAVEQNIPQKRPLPQQKVETPEQIGTGTWILMIGTALFFDACEALLSLVPILGQILAILLDMVAFGTFWLWFKIKGSKYSKKTFLGGFIIGLIPFVNALPECTVTIVMLYFNAKAKKATAIVPGGKLATQAYVQGYMAKNTVMVNGERKHKSDTGNPNSKPAFARFQDVPTSIDAPKLSRGARSNLEKEGEQIITPIINNAKRDFPSRQPTRTDSNIRKNEELNKKVIMMPKRDY